MAAERSDTTGKRTVRFLLENQPWAREFKAAGVTSDLFELEFDPADVASSRFKAFVREGAHDFGELAIVTYMQALYYDQPFVLLPLVVLGGYHHKSIVYNSDRGTITPETMEGHRFGVRTYSQTTGVWARGILQHDYGVDPAKVTWVTFDEAHLPGHADPPHCVRAPKGKQLVPMMLDGEIDGVIGATSNDPRIRHLIPDHEDAAEDWGRRHGCRPINHMFVATRELCENRPDVVRELYETMVKVRTAADYPFPVGFDGDWTALRLVSRYAHEQGVVPREYAPEELFAEAARVLGA